MLRKTRLVSSRTVIVTDMKTARCRQNLRHVTVEYRKPDLTYSTNREATSDCENIVAFSFLFLTIWTTVVSLDELSEICVARDGLRERTTV